MRESRIKSVLETATNIAVLVTAIAVAAFFLTNYYRQRHAPKTPELELGLDKGSTLPQIQGLSYDGSNRTLLIVINTRCEYCANSVQFYNRVAEAQMKARSPVKIVALFPNSADDVKKFINERHLNVDTVSGADLAKLRLPGTPALLLVDDAGSIRDFWIGKLTPESEEQVIKSVTEFPS